MKEHKQIRWLGDERELPGHGSISVGQERVLPRALAESYIEQGLAEVVKPKPKKEKD